MNKNEQFEAPFLNHFFTVLQSFLRSSAKIFYIAPLIEHLVQAFKAAFSWFLK